VRIDKYLAHAGYGSRNDCKQLLKDKAVQIDGVLVKDAKTKVDIQAQVVTVRGTVAEYKEFIYLMMNKPGDCLSATKDKSGRTVIDLLSEDYLKYAPVPAGRLDRDTEGLMLLTNDGALVHGIISPKKEVYKRYVAKISGELTEEGKAKLESGVQILDGQNEPFTTKPAKVEMLGDGLVGIEIAEGKFHQVKRMFASVGCKVTYLKREAIGALELDPALGLGECRELTEEELGLIKDIKK